MSTVIETRLATARTRRMLEDTAINAAGGGMLANLREDPAAPGRWSAEVRTPDGTRLELCLDTALETVSVVRADALTHAA